MPDDPLLIAFAAIDPATVAIRIADRFSADPNGNCDCAQLVRRMVTDHLFDDDINCNLQLSDNGAALYRQTFLTFDDIKDYLINTYRPDMGDADMAGPVMMLCI